MKTKLFIAVLMLLPYSLFSQTIEGSWYGILKTENFELKIVFNISKTDTLYTATMDSPDQGVKGIPVSKTEFSNSIVKLFVSSAMVEYSGVFMGDKIIGTFKQGPATIPLNLSRRPFEGPKRPQEPKAPFPYVLEEIVFNNSKAGIELSGTLTLPENGKPKALVILISGSGPQNRDEEIMNHKPFLLWADYLTKKGIGVLRFDDRGIGKSKGNFAQATSFDFADDVSSAVDYLKSRSDLKGIRIGLMGHSEGGIIAPIVASNRDDINFLVLLAAPGVKGSQIIVSQQELIGKASGVSDSDVEDYSKITKNLYAIIEKESNNPNLKKLLEDFIQLNAGQKVSEGQLAQQLAILTSPWMMTFLNYDPADALTKIKIPVIAINGTKDLQVPYEMNISALERSLLTAHGGDKDSLNRYVTIKKIEGVNHLFQKAETGLPAEYSKIEETISPVVLELISKWILENGIVY
jgi:alpha/beta superfamily hydrolase